MVHPNTINTITLTDTKPAATGLMSAALVHFESVSGVDMTGPSLLEPVVLSDDCGVAPVSLMAAGVSAAVGMVSSSATAAVDNHADIGKTSIEASIRFMARLLCVMDRRRANPECLRVYRRTPWDAPDAYVQPACQARV
jgi:hypothetical protein